MQILTSNRLLLSSDVRLSAALSDSGNVVHISVALGCRSASGGDKEFHVGRILFMIMNNSVFIIFIDVY